MGGQTNPSVKAMFGASMIHPIREAAKRFVGAN